MGAPYDDDNGSDSGAAFVFARNMAGQWVQVKQLLPLTSTGGNDGAQGDNFGFSVDTSGDVVVVGSPRDDLLGLDFGSAYIYARDQGGAGAWGQVTQLVPPSALNNDNFGYSVGVSRDMVVVGMPYAGADNQSRFGTAYAFGRNQGGSNVWGLFERLVRINEANNDHFGQAVAIGGGTVVVGTPLDDDQGLDSGSAFIYEIQFNNAPALAVPIADQVAVVGQAFTYVVPQGTFGDSDVGDVLRLSATLSGGGPLTNIWLSFDSLTRTFSGTPGSADVGSLGVIVTATDLDGLTASDTFVINVVAAGSMGLAGSSRFVIDNYDTWISRLMDADTLANSSLEISLWGRGADPDGDGRTSLAEYGFGGNPLINGKADRVLAVQRGTGGTLWLSYVRRWNDPTLRFIAEASADLTTWTEAENLLSEPLRTPLDTQYERVSYALPPSPCQFFRVRLIVVESQ